MSIEISAVACSSCNLASCREEGDLLYVPVPLLVIQDAIDKTQGNKFSLIVNVSIEPEPGSPENSTSPSFITDVGTIEERKSKLGRQLETRRTASELRDLGILMSSSSYQSGAILRKGQELERARVSNVLSKKIKMRPNKDELVSHNILKESSVEPLVNFAHNKMKRRRLEDQIGRHIANRPSPASIPENIMVKPISPTVLNKHGSSFTQESSENPGSESGDMTRPRENAPPTPPPLPATISIDNKIRRAVTTQESITKSGGFIFHNESQSTVPSSQASSEDTRTKQHIRAVLDKIKAPVASLEEEVSCIYQQMTVPHLRALCQHRGFSVRKKSTKSQLIECLMKSEPESRAEGEHLSQGEASFAACRVPLKPKKALPAISREEIVEIMNRTPSTSTMGGEFSELSIKSPDTPSLSLSAHQSFSYSTDQTSLVSQMRAQRVSWPYLDVTSGNPEHHSNDVFVQPDDVFQQRYTHMNDPTLRMPNSSSMDSLPSVPMDSSRPQFYAVSNEDVSIDMSCPQSVSTITQDTDEFDPTAFQQFEENFSACLESVSASDVFDRSPLSMSGLEDLLSCSSPFGGTVDTCNY